MRFLWMLLPTALFFGTIPSDLAIAQRALQQIRTLIPERLSVEEFSIIVDQKAFAEALGATSHPKREPAIPSGEEVGCSHFYLTRWTISGESVRILDFYQEFEYGPYWRYPTAIQRLYDMHHINRGTQ